MWIRICIAGYELKILDEKLTNFRKLKGEKNLSGNNEKSITILAIENKMFVKNYQKIKDYKHFIKIFPDYQDIAIDNKNIDNKNLDSHYYLIDYCYKTIFKQQNIRFRNIEDQSFFDKMSSNLSIHYKEYSEIIKQYSYGPNLIKIRKLRKKINKLKYYFLFPLIVVFIFLLFY